MTRANIVLMAALCAGLLAAAPGCDCEGDCKEDFEKCIEGIPNDPATGEPYNLQDYCAEGEVSGNQAEILFCSCAFRYRKCKKDC